MPELFIGKINIQYLLDTFVLPGKSSDGKPNIVDLS